MNNSNKKTTSNNIIEMFMYPVVDAILEKKVKEAFDINPSQSHPLNFQMLKACVECTERDFWDFMFHNSDVLATPVLEKYEGCNGETFLVISKSYLTEFSVIYDKITLCGLFIDDEGKVEYSMYSPEIATNRYWEKTDLEAENKTILDYLYLISEWYWEDKEKY